MKKVEISESFHASPDTIRENLFPRSIIEYQETFDVLSTNNRGENCILTVTTEEIKPELEIELEFTEIECGYEYEQVGDGVFDEFFTEIIVKEDGSTTTVTVRSWFTFGGIFARIKNWFAETAREEEIRRLLFNISQEIEE